jgi:hypothetical protein
LYEVLRAGKFVLLAPDAAKPALGGWHDRILLAPPIDATMPWTLVRPDAHIAWRGGPATLRTALLETGAPTRSSSRSGRRTPRRPAELGDANALL